MTYIRQSYSDLVRYTLRGLVGNKEISAPLNWDEDEKEFKRSTKVHGVFINLSNNLEFYKGDENNDGGYDYLKQTFDLYGINAEVLLVKEEKINDKWTESYRGYLDFSTYSRKNNKIKLKFNESGLYEKIKARQSEDLELDRTETMGGISIPELETDIVALDGRKIQTTSQFIREAKWVDVLPDLADDEARAIPMKMVAEQTGNVQTVYEYDVDENNSSYGEGTVGNMFYSNTSAPATINISFDIEVFLTFQGASNKVKLDLVKYDGADIDEYNFVERTTLKEEINLSGNSNFLRYKGEINNLDVAIGESYCLAIHFTGYNGLILMFPNKADVVISETAFYEKSDSKMLLPYETLDRILHIITDEENTLYSKALGRTDILNDNGTPKYSEDGYASLTGLSSGFWVRKFDEKPFKTSFKDFEESFTSAWQMAYGIEKIGFRERVRMEKITHFYQPIVTMVIDAQPKDIERTVANEYFYSSLDLGYEKPSGDNLYEESMGLDEYNIRNTYTTTISRIENKFERKSKYRADSYGKEFARRKQKLNFPQEDTRYDDDIFLQDLKRGDTDIFVERKWEDDFEIPKNSVTFVEELTRDTTGVFSPETATNLRFSPINLLLRWGFWVKGGLNKYKDTYIRYSSSKGNSNLKTQLRTDLYPDSKEYEEGGNVLVSDLDKALFEPEYIEFEYPVSNELLSQINGTTTIDGDKIMNYYGLVQFINEDGLNEFGYLMELKPNKQGKWKLLKANKKAIRRSVITDNGGIIPKPDAENQGGFDYELNTEIDG